VEIVHSGADFAKGLGADCVVSVGGGSAIDTAKAMAILLKSGGTLSDYAGVNMLTQPQTPHIAIPTTAGTGSEMTYVAVILDRKNKRKLFFTDNNIFPNTAILDPELTLSLPAHLTAATGMDALTHAVEALHSTLRNPVSDAAAMHAIRIVNRYLPKAVTEPDNITARGQMLVAASLGGTAFTNAMVSVVHAMAHSIGGICGVHHGLANSVMLPHGMRFNVEEIPDLYVDAAVALDVYKPPMDPAQAGEMAAQRVYEIAKECGLPTSLGEAGVPRETLPEIAEASLSDGSILYNPRIVTDAGEILSILEKAY